jgi:hypothetical protein
MGNKNAKKFIFSCRNKIMTYSCNCTTEISFQKKETKLPGNRKSVSHRKKKKIKNMTEHENTHDCNICDSELKDPCNHCKVYVTDPNTPCPLVKGSCGCTFHHHCAIRLKHLGSGECPVCDAEVWPTIPVTTNDTTNSTSDSKTDVFDEDRPQQED